METPGDERAVDFIVGGCLSCVSMALGYKLEDEGRLLFREEAYQQVNHSASFQGGVEVCGGAEGDPKRSEWLF